MLIGSVIGCIAGVSGANGYGRESHFLLYSFMDYDVNDASF